MPYHVTDHDDRLAGWRDHCVVPITADLDVLGRRLVVRCCAWTSALSREVRLDLTFTGEVRNRDTGDRVAPTSSDDTPKRTGTVVSVGPTSTASTEPAGLADPVTSLSRSRLDVRTRSTKGVPTSCG